MMKKLYFRLRGTLFCCALALSTSPSFAEPVPDPSPKQEDSALDIVKDTSVSVQVGVNVGLLALDLQVKNFYAFAAGNVGVQLLAEWLVFSAGAGYTTALSKPAESMWFVDFFGIANPARTNWADSRGHVWGVGLGAGLGVRYLHRSGFTLSLKLPVFGAYLQSGDWGNEAKMLGNFFLANAIALPVVSVGYRF